MDFDNLKQERKLQYEGPHCRTCATATDTLISIFSEDGKKFQLPEFVEKYLPINILEDDILPANLCQNCIATLSRWDEFINGIPLAEHRLHNICSQEFQQHETLIEAVSNPDSDSENEPLAKMVSPVKKKKGRRKKTTEESNEVSRSTAETVIRKDSVCMACMRLVSSMDEHLTKFETCSKLSVNHCSVCGDIVQGLTDHSSHLYAHLDIPSAKSDCSTCQLCGTSFTQISHLLGHLLHHMGNRTNVHCVQCNREVLRETLKKHISIHSQEKGITCHHCGKQYAQVSGLMRHVRVSHEGKKRYKCPICATIFQSNDQLREHQAGHDDPKPFQCDSCGRTFPQQKQLYHHNKYHHTKNGISVPCNLCSRLFSSMSALRRHEKAVHLRIKEFKCEICSVQFSTKQYLREHLRTHSDERPEICSVCGKSFQLVSNLRQHRRVHMERKLACDVCGKRFVRRCHLVTHMGSHQGIVPPKCALCNQTFLLKTDLKKHFATVHYSLYNEATARQAIPTAWLSAISCETCERVGTKNLSPSDGPIENIQCGQCEKVLSSTASYITHLKRHVKEAAQSKQYNCRNCQRTFKKESHAAEHERICGLEEQYPCEGCGKRCESQEAAQTHARSHHRSCVCHLCGQTFPKPMYLKQHTQTVHEDTRMVCHYCGKSFSRKARLLEHIQRHTGKMDFTCHICGKGSTNSYAFSVHLATHTQETPFTCSFCPRTFKHMKYVYLHERAVHYKIKTKPKKSKNLDQRTCSECGKTFKRESAMLIHKRTVHEGKNGYICKICGKDFKYTYLLYVHKKKQHFPEQCKYSCQFCQKPFPVRTELEKHLRKHTGEKPFVCSECGKRYSFHGSLTMHVKIQHQQNTKFPCSLCNASFNFRSRLLRHMTAHVGRLALQVTE